MLVVTRKQGERLWIGDNVVVTVIECKGGRVRLGLDAPQAVAIYREEIRNDFRAPCPPEEESEAQIPSA
jgi:carbon storage regulator